MKVFCVKFTFQSSKTEMLYNIILPNKLYNVNIALKILHFIVTFFQEWGRKPGIFESPLVKSIHTRNSIGLAMKFQGILLKSP